MPFDLKPEELRVLGVLIEKSLSQPAYYPMTLNSITNASNQKTNRDPISAYSEGEISAALSSLRRRQLASQAEPERTSRAIRFQHGIEGQFGWNAAQRALMAELMLRGPQTTGELRTRASRMTHLQGTDYARELLGELERADPPLVVELAREPGRTSRRFAHLLGGPVEIASHDAVAPVSAMAVTAEEGASQTTPSAPLERRVEQLEAEIADLRASMTGLRECLREAGMMSDGA